MKRYLTRQSKDYADQLVDAGISNGMDLLKQLAVCRKSIRKKSQLIAKVEHDKDSEEGDAAALELAKLQAWEAELVASSPIPQLQQQFDNFLPVYLHAMDFTHLNSFHGMDGIHYFPNDTKVHMAGHLLSQTLRLEVPAVKHCAVFARGYESYMDILVDEKKRQRHGWKTNQQTHSTPFGLPSKPTLIVAAACRNNASGLVHSAMSLFLTF
ncbi:unnamed protein product [Aphanomyces euteiches]